MGQDWTLWGQHPEYAGGVPIKVTGGSLAAVRAEREWRERHGWTVTVARTGHPRPWFPTHDSENRCVSCREHIVDPHAPGCQMEAS